MGAGMGCLAEPSAVLTTSQQNFLPDQYLHILVDGNLDLACLVVENVAVRRGMQDVDRILEAEYEARRIHRHVRTFPS